MALCPYVKILYLDRPVFAGIAKHSLYQRSLSPESERNVNSEYLRFDPDFHPITRDLALSGFRKGLFTRPSNLDVYYYAFPTVCFSKKRFICFSCSFVSGSNFNPQSLFTKSGINVN